MLGKGIRKRNERAFFWWLVLPLHSLCLTAFTAPVYGFNVLVRPINDVFSPESPTSGWAGALTGSLILLAVGCGGFKHEAFLRALGSRTRFFLVLNAVLIGAFIVGGLALTWKLYWLLLLGFAIPVGLVCANVFTIAATYLLGWGRKYNHAGISTGVFGMFLGLWGAAYSFCGPYILEKLGLTWTLAVTGLAVALVQLSTLLSMDDPLPLEPLSPLEQKRQSQF